MRSENLSVWQKKLQMMRQTNLQSRPGFRARHTATDTCLQILKQTTLTARPKVFLLSTLFAIRTNDADEAHRTRSQETRRRQPVPRAPSPEPFHRPSRTNSVGHEQTTLKTRNCARYSCVSTEHDTQGLPGSGSCDTGFGNIEPGCQQGLPGSGSCVMGL